MSSSRFTTLARVFRVIVFYAFLGIVLTYAAAAFAVRFLPVPTFSYSCAGRIHRAEFGTSRPYLRLRVWDSPHGSYFQIHQTRAAAVAMYHELDSLPPRQREVLIENPKLEDPGFIPEWSRMRRDWPDALADQADLFAQSGVWYELIMGWPFPCLRGGFTEPDSLDTGRIRDVYGAVPLSRTVTFANGAKVPLLVAFPLIPTWPAFLISVCLYGVIVFAVVLGQRSFFRWRRRRAGRCLQCGYDLRASKERCPECGTPFVSRGVLDAKLPT